MIKYLHKHPHNQKSVKPVNYSLDSQKISFEFLKSHLWSAADILRGSLDSSEYRQPVMTLLFLKRLNDTFEENAENLIKKGINKKEAYNKRRHNFYIPDNARWTVLSSTAENIGEKIDEANILLMLTYAYKELEFLDEEISFPENKNFHEILIEVLTKRLESLLERGVLKSYSEIEENLPYVKGRILVLHQLRYNMILKHKTYCRYADLTQDILENQIIKFTLYYIIKHHVVSDRLKKSLRKLYQSFEFVSLRAVNFTSFANLQFNRLNQQYKPILRICEILIRNGSIEVNASGDYDYESFAFLLDMNKLFEGFIREYLRQNLEPTGLTVVKGHHYLDEDNVIELDPDIEIKKNDSTLLIIDTKYKILDDKEATRSDVSQVLDYCLVYKIKTGILLYPKLKDEILRTYGIKNTDIQVNLLVINISSKNKIRFLGELESFKDSLIMIIKPSSRDEIIHKRELHIVERKL
jgi:5-methylcytosine-specific restriction enzyme subunit McrC